MPDLTTGGNHEDLQGKLGEWQREARGKEYWRRVGFGSAKKVSCIKEPVTEAEGHGKPS